MLLNLFGYYYFFFIILIIIYFNESFTEGEVCLYDIQSDPCEEKNLATYFPSVVRRMKREMVDYKAGLTPQLNEEPDIEKDDPKLFQYTWNPWVDCADVTCTS